MRVTAIRIDCRDAPRLFAKDTRVQPAFDVGSSNSVGNSREQRPARERLPPLALNLLRGKWKVEILLLMANGPVRLGQLRRLIPHATKKMLVQRLHEMEKEGIISRTDLSGTIKHVEYTVSSPLGAAILNLLDLVTEWGRRNLPVSIAGGVTAPKPPQRVVLPKTKLTAQRWNAEFSARPPRNDSRTRRRA